MKTIKVVLEGGPPSLPETHRVHEVTDLTDRVRVIKGNGYEHFEYTGGVREVNGVSMPVFRWFQQTKIAE